MSIRYQSKLTAITTLAILPIAVIAAEPQQKLCYTYATVKSDISSKITFITDVGKIYANPSWQYFDIERMKIAYKEIPFSNYIIPNSVEPTMRQAILSFTRRMTSERLDEKSALIEEHCFETKEGADAMRSLTIRAHLGYSKDNKIHEVAGEWETDQNIPIELRTNFPNTAQQTKKASQRSQEPIAQKLSPTTSKEKHDGEPFKPAVQGPRNKEKPVADRHKIREKPEVALFSVQNGPEPDVVPTDNQPDAFYAPSKDYTIFQSYVSEEAARSSLQKMIDYGNVYHNKSISCTKSETITGAFGKYLWTCSVRNTPEASPPGKADPATGSSITK